MINIVESFAAAVAVMLVDSALNSIFSDQTKASAKSNLEFGHGRCWSFHGERRMKLFWSGCCCYLIVEVKGQWAVLTRF